MPQRLIESLEPRTLLAAFSVTNINDAGDGSLRQAVLDANAAPGADTIGFSPALDKGLIVLTSGTLSITDPLTITGLGADRLSVESDTRAFDIAPTINVTIARLAIVKCAYGGVLNSGILTLSEVLLYANESGGDGGGIRNNGALTVDSCLIWGNTADGYGGGIGNYGTATINNSTITGNSASIKGGGIDNFSATLTINNSTIAGNSANAGLNNEATATLISTIVAGNTGGDIVSNALAAGSTNNLIQDAATAGGLSNGVNGNLVGVDPLLGTLAANGGPTFTLAPQAGSPAIGAGANPAAFTADQRGGPFGRGTAVDIGAYQRQSLALTVDNPADGDDGDYSAAHLSLREAVNLANANPGADSIGFSADLNGQTIGLNGTHIPITADLTITGPGASTLSVDANTLSRVFQVSIGATVSIGGLTLRNGRLTGNDSGSIILNAGTLTLSRSILTGGSGTGYVAGALFNSGTLTVTDCTISANNSGNGGAISNFGILTVTGSTISGNVAAGGYGGGIYTAGFATVTNSTISGNTAAFGGGIANEATLNVRNSTIALNNTGGGVYVNGPTTLTSTIVAGNGQGDVTHGTLASTSQNNLIQDSATAGGLGTNDGKGNLLGVDPLLGPLAANGGPTQTMAPGASSPALAKGSNPGGLMTDQRGGPFKRGTAVDIGAYQRQSLNLVVDTATDEHDESWAAGDLSLREAIALAGPNPGDDTVTFAPALKGQTLTLGGTELSITGDLMIDGPGAGLLALDGGGLSRIATVQSGSVVTIRGLTLSGGNSYQDGGSINNLGTLTLSRVHVTGNHSAFSGAGVHNTGTLTVLNSTISGNSTDFDGGAIVSHAGSVTITGSTISGNTALYVGGVANLNSTLVVQNSTVSGNSAAGGFGAIYAGGTTTVLNSTIASNNTVGIHVSFPAMLTSTIVADNIGGDIGGGFLDAASSNNLVKDATFAGGLIHGANANLLGVDPLLGPLGDYGGLTRTMALGAGSPAIGKGLNPASLTTDQRGGPFVRGVAVDVGAFQRQTLSMVVDTLVDEDDGNYAAGDVSLREALTLTNRNPGAETITFAPGLAGTVTLSGTSLQIRDDLTLTGPGAGTLAISGNNASRILNMDSATNVSISGLTFKNGKNVGSYGGGLSVYGVGTVTIANCNFSGSSAFRGGAIYSLDANLTLNSCTVTGNSASQRGGGIFSRYGSLSINACTIAANTSIDGAGIESEESTLTVTNSTISGNTASGSGGGCFVDDSSITVRNTTVVGNSASSGGGIHWSGSGATITNTTIAGNLGGAGLLLSDGPATLVSTIIAGNIGGDIAGGMLALGSINNLIKDAASSGGLLNGVGGNIVGVGPYLGPLANNGGPTQTMVPLLGSPVINKGANPAGLTTDQRGTGFARTQGTAIDIGAAEFSAAPTIATLTPSATSVARGQGLTLTAAGVADADGSVAAVNFYRDKNNNGQKDAGEFLGTDSSSAGGFTFAVSGTQAFSLGAISFLAEAVDANGLTSPLKKATVTFTNTAPGVGSLGLSTPAPVQGDVFTLTASQTTDTDGIVVSISFYADANKNGVADASELLGTDTSSAGGFTLALTQAQSYALSGGALSFLAVATDNDGGKSAPKAAATTVAGRPAEKFIYDYNAAPKAPSGLVDGDWIVTSLKAGVSNVATSNAYWGATNHWFQDNKGDVWALWQGGDVHNSPTLAGQHQWVLTNLTDAGGLSGSMSFAPGSLSGITTGWNAFNIQGVQGGKLFALWWSPEGSAGTYLEADGTSRQGKAWGLKGNGWILSSITDAATLVGGAAAAPPAAFRAFSESQGNGRTEADPRSTRTISNTGMAVVLVDQNNRVYALVFSVSQRPIAGANAALNGVWTLEKFSELPSLQDFGLGAQVPAFEAAYVDAAT